MLKLFALLTLVLTGLMLAAACSSSEPDPVPLGKRPTTVQSTGTSAAEEEAQRALEEGLQTSVTIQVVGTASYMPNNASVFANRDITITLDNTKSGEQHNLVIYDRNRQPIVTVPTCTGPCQSQATFNLPAGRYNFSCTIDPEMMGRIVVQ